MAYFEWASDMEIDHGPIDEDHLQLVRLVNALHDATSEGRGKEVVGEILESLVAYTTDHLRKEEAEMAAAGFPNLERHNIGHQAFIDQLHQLQTQYAGGSISVAAKLSSVLRDWLSLHIRRSDRELRQYLLARAAQTRP